MLLCLSLAAGLAACSGEKTKPTEEPISGDYNEYASVISQELRGRSVTLKGDGKLIFLAIWTEGDYSYSVSVSNGMTSAAILDLVNALK